MTRRTSWKRDRGDAYDLRLVVRCQRRRFLGVGMGEPAPIITLSETVRAPRGGVTEELSAAFQRGEHGPRPWVSYGGLDGVELPGERFGPWSYPCPNHRDGHKVDGVRLRDAIVRLCRPGRIANIDVAEVEVIAPSSDKLSSKSRVKPLG